MTVKVYRTPDDQLDRDLARVRVKTTDATGKTREYTVSLSPQTLGVQGHLMAGRRVEPEPGPDEMAPVPPTERAYRAAAKVFVRHYGYEVYGHDIDDSGPLPEIFGDDGGADS
jgi:hypothetical protein